MAKAKIIYKFEDELVVIENDIIGNISDGIKISVEKIKSNQG
jgi:hypothetical protein